MDYEVLVVYAAKPKAKEQRISQCVGDLQEAFDLIAEHYGNAVPPKEVRIITRHSGD